MTYLPVLLVFFFASGCSALIYEIVWFQLLQLVIGSTAVSLAVLLGTFMGGMCLGSLALPWISGRRRHPLFIYALLEFGIAICGLALLLLIPHFGGALFSAICLLPPTLLMGATLPAVARWVETTPRGISWLGFLYSANIAGAVFGCLLAGFYLLRVHDTATATYVAVSINLAVGLAALGLATRTPPISKISDKEKAPAGIIRGSWPVYVVIALSGLSALGAEVVWTRLLSLMLGATVYTFSIILAVFLLGLWIGSSAGSFIVRGTARPQMALGVCQMLLAGAIAWSAYMITSSLPYWPVNPAFSPSPWLTFQIDLVRCLLAVLPAACLWGASFPLALASVTAGPDTGRLVGRVYAANTAGGIVGAIGFSMLVIPALGTQQSQRLLIGLATLAALLMLVVRIRKPVHIALLAASTILAVWLAAGVAAIPPGIIGYGRSMMTYTSMPNFLYVGEGMNSSIAVSELDSGVRNFHVSGKIEASSEELDMRLQLMLGNIPAMLHPNPRSVLVVGFGAGVTAGSFIPYPEVERIVICEIEPLIPQIASQYFTDQNQRVLSDPRVEVVYDDARHYILTTGEKFDIITSDPIHPWVKGAATLYTREYFDLVRRRLNPGGVVTQWVPLYESSQDVVKSEIATFFEAFPGGAVFGNAEGGEGYDVVLVGQAQPGQIDAEETEQRLSRPEYGTVLRVLNAVGFGSAADLMDTYAASDEDLKPWLAGAEINRDRSLRLQYLAGLGLNLTHGAAIYRDILSYRKADAVNTDVR